MLRKYLVVTCLVVSSLVSSNIFAETLMWSQQGKNALQELRSNAWYSRSRFQHTSYNKSINLVALKNASYVRRAFENNGLQIRRVQGESTSGRNVYVSTVGTESCQCVALVKSITGTEGISTRSWKPSIALTPNNVKNGLIRIGTAIATFSGQSYNHSHTAIVTGYSGRGDWIEVIDQNWSPIVDIHFDQRELPEGINGGGAGCTWNAGVPAWGNSNLKGFVMKHRIYFNNSASYVANAYSYNVIDL